MSAYVYIAIFASIYFILTNYWKSKNATIFLFLCAGNVLSATSSGAVSSFLSSLISNETLPLLIIVKSIMLLLPSVLVLLITRGKSKKKFLILNILFGAINAVLAYLWFIRTLSYDQFIALENTDITKQLLMVRDYLIGAGVLIGIVYVLLEAKKKPEKHKKNKKGD